MPRAGGCKHRRDNAHVWFWSNVDRSTGCWIWQGSVTKDGCGIVYFEGRPQTVGSVSYQLIYGPMPEGKEACHNCGPNADDRRCIHPAHLWAGTHSENVKDRWQKWQADHPDEKMRYAQAGTHPRYEENRARYLAKKNGAREEAAPYLIGAAS